MVTRSRLVATLVSAVVVVSLLVTGLGIASGLSPYGQSPAAAHEIVLTQGSSGGDAAPGGDASKETRRGSKSSGPASVSKARITSYSNGVRVETLSPHVFHGNVKHLRNVTPRYAKPIPEMNELPKGLNRFLPGLRKSHFAPRTAGPASPSTTPSPQTTFNGLNFQSNGAGFPPDTNGDVGSSYYIQTVNTSIGIFDKSTGSQSAAFTFNSLFAAAADGTPCVNNNEGDPVVLYDSFTDRWIITDFASTGNYTGTWYQCMAVSKSSDPIGGGWYFYDWQTSTTSLPDYPKFGLWPDGLYMSANLFANSNGAFQNAEVYAFDKANMEAGLAATMQSFAVPIDSGATPFSLLPANARSQAGAPPAGRPNIFVSTSDFSNALQAWAFHVDFTTPANSTFGAPTHVAINSYTGGPADVQELAPGNLLDTLTFHSMMQNQYQNLGGVESLWDTQTVTGTNNRAAIQWYQVDVTGGTPGNRLQEGTLQPDTGLNRFMPSGAVDKLGDYAVGYTSANAQNPTALDYAGRLAGDAAGTLSNTEQTLFAGTGYQCCSFSNKRMNFRFGDYSAMTLDPDGCSFWYTGEYFKNAATVLIGDGSNDDNWQTRIGKFQLNPNCTPLVSGTISGTVTDGSSNPIGGAVVKAGSGSTTTANDGTYTLANLATGPYAVTVSDAAYATGSANATVNASQTTTQNFTLSASPSTGCFTTTSQPDFNDCTGSNADTILSPGDVTLARSQAVDQSNTTLSTTGSGLSTTTWYAQSFTPATTGLLTQADIHLFCFNCSTTTVPPLTVEVRTTSGGLPTTTVLASTTIPGFNSGSDVSYPAIFSSPASLTSGTVYALVLRKNSANTGTGILAVTRSSTDVYGGGTRLLGSSCNSGTGACTWSTPLTSGHTTDIGFTTYMSSGFSASGTITSTVNDNNPPAGLAGRWKTLSWTVTTPANTSVQFQLAASNSQKGPFNFVGPDGTSGTFFTSSGAVLAPEFNGYRYMEWKAFLSTSDGTVTPTLSDVTLCYIDGSPTAARITRFTVHRQNGGLTFRWHVPSAAGIAGFNVYAGKAKLNRKLIPIARGHNYTFHTRLVKASTYSLHAVLTGGRQLVFLAG